MIDTTISIVDPITFNRLCSVAANVILIRHSATIRKRKGERGVTLASSSLSFEPVSCLPIDKHDKFRISINFPIHLYHFSLKPQHFIILIRKAQLTLSYAFSKSTDPLTRCLNVPSHNLISSNKLKSPLGASPSKKLIVN